VPPKGLAIRLERMVRPTLPGFSVAPMRATDLGLKKVFSELRAVRGLVWDMVGTGVWVAVGSLIVP
jgi:hypothetical protein